MTAATRKQILRKPVSENEQLLIKHSDRMMLLFWSDEVELGNAQKIIISADFLLDQDSFWEGKGDMDSQQIRNYSMISLQGIGSL